jgi:HTH-type transcriptional regulator / antitoxin HigA
MLNLRNTTLSTHRVFEVSAVDIAPIKSHRDYRRVLREIEGLMECPAQFARGRSARCTGHAGGSMGAEALPARSAGPVEAIKYHMAQSGLHPRDLIPFIGSRNRVHEVLNRRRELTLNMIRRLHEGLGIPAESLIKVGQHKAA